MVDRYAAWCPELEQGPEGAWEIVAVDGYDAAETWAACEPTLDEVFWLTRGAGLDVVVRNLRTGEETRLQIQARVQVVLEAHLRR